MSRNNKYIEINDIDELQLIGNDAGYPLDGDYVLGNDIDASATATWNDGAGFMPIAPYVHPIASEDSSFTGTFDGAGYTISDLTINRPLEYMVGLFASVYGATLQNIGLENGTVTGRETTGGLVGLVGDNSSLTNCYSTGTVTTTGGEGIVGGLVGVLSSGSLTNCYSTGTVTATGGMAGGGFVGEVNGNNTITNCYSTGVVTVTEDWLVGGFVGVVFGNNFTNCYWDIESSGQTSSVGGRGLTTAEMMQQASFKDWDFTTVWAICPAGSYPYLQNNHPNDICESSEGE